ncbi:MAG: hypothetical protein FJ267_12745, partial [Planctomycetes bacterium]|nr:hypothetical protein [Planctomycetota bacterium]
MVRRLLCLFIVLGQSLVSIATIPSRSMGADDAANWKAGVASVDITPRESMWMAGYASRMKPSEGIISPLFAKAMFLEDSNRNRFVLVTLDLIGFPRSMRDVIAERIGTSHNIRPESLMINASHTHSGPVIRWSGSGLDDLVPDEAKKVDEYNEILIETLVKLISESISKAVPARLGYSHARCGFAMNRRLPTENGYQNSPNPEGLVDHSVPVLRVESLDGKLLAIAFGYACHNTTLGLFEFCGDYAGFAQQYLEE